MLFATDAEEPLFKDPAPFPVFAMVAPVGLAPTTAPFVAAAFVFAPVTIALLLVALPVSIFVLPLFPFEVVPVPALDC